MMCKSRDVSPHNIIALDIKVQILWRYVEMFLVVMQQFYVVDAETKELSCST
jgi:hypothetical protein